MRAETTGLTDVFSSKRVRQMAMTLWQTTRRGKTSSDDLVAHQEVGRIVAAHGTLRAANG